jgi:hypothetical protein
VGECQQEGFGFIELKQEKGRGTCGSHSVLLFMMVKAASGQRRKIEQLRQNASVAWGEKAQFCALRQFVANTADTQARIVKAQPVDALQLAMSKIPIASSRGIGTAIAFLSSRVGGW